MPLEPGATLGPYSVTAKIGEGGMGEVYRARDTKLDRDVALKVLPHAFTDDPDRLARFEREAKVLASLNHPNIGHIYGLEEAEGQRALVLELVEGPTLADRIKHGPIPLDEALPIAKQIAEALEAAHEAGVIHRDLKPANIKVKDDGRVKMLDFGLAKTLDLATQGATPSQISESPTLTMEATLQGVILGTAAYMSPEQARGGAADKRADVWAFGCVLFEMLSGQRAFEGSTVSDVLAAVLRIEPDWTRLSSDLHPRLRLALERTLEKSTKDRYHDIADVRVDVERVLAAPDGVSFRSGTEAAPACNPWSLRAAAVVAAVAAVGGALAGYLLTLPASSVVRHLSIVLPEGQSVVNAQGALDVSADGSQVVYRAAGQLNLRDLGRLESVPIRGTEGTPWEPLFSPDGRSVGYFEGDELRRISVSGGAAVRVADVIEPRGAVWGTDGTIVYASETGICRVSANGGEPERLIESDPGERVYGPQILPDGVSVLFTALDTAMGPGSAAWDAAQIVVQSLETGERHVVIDGGSDARYLSTGHLSYAVSNVLFAVPFDVARYEVVGGPVPMVEAVRRPTRAPSTTSDANYGVSATGSLVYLPGVDIPPVNRQLVFVDRDGNEELVTADLRDYWRPRLSPDGRRVTVEVLSEELGVLNLWVVDVTSGNARQLTFGRDGSGDLFPAWTSDGRHVIFSSGRSGQDAIYRQAADGTGEPELLFEGGAQLIPNDVSPDGVLAFTQGPRTGLSDVWGLRVADQSSVELVATPAMENMPMFSPDGRWLAYTSDASGQNEVWVRAVHNTDTGEWRVSEGGGVGPVWSRDGSELYYRGAGGELMVVSVEPSRTFTYGPSQPLFPVAQRFRFSGNTAAFDVDSTGRFIMVTAGERPPSQPQQINVVLDWHQELLERVPVP